MTPYVQKSWAESGKINHFVKNFRSENDFEPFWKASKVQNKKSSIFIFKVLQNPKKIRSYSLVTFVQAIADFVKERDVKN